jgi:hypothetical protein
MIAGLCLAAFLGVGGPGQTQSAEEIESQCRFQAELFGAVQQARLDRVRKNRVIETVMEANPDWPPAIATALPAVTEYVWGFPMRDLRNADLAADTLRTCIENYDQIRSLSDSVQN